MSDIDPDLLAAAGREGIDPERLPDLLRPGRPDPVPDADSEALRLRCPVCGAEPLMPLLVWFSVGGHVFSSLDGLFAYAPETLDDPKDVRMGAMECHLECPEGHRSVLDVAAFVPPRGVSLTPSALGRKPPGR